MRVQQVDLRFPKVYRIQIKNLTENQLRPLFEGIKNEFLRKTL
jgi:hypothetical protein